MCVILVSFVLPFATNIKLAPFNFRIFIYRHSEEIHHCDHKQHKGIVRRLLAPIQTTRVAFTAYIDKTISHLGINHIVPFDKVLLNEGNAFNTYTGIFHCTQSGVYLFSFTIESDSDGIIAAKLVIDGNNQLDVATDGGSVSFQTASNTAIVRVVSGQSVWVAIYAINDRTLFGTNIFHYTSFSGVLLF